MKANCIPEDVYDEGSSGYCARCCSGRFLNCCSVGNDCSFFLDIWWQGIDKIWDGEVYRACE